MGVRYRLRGAPVAGAPHRPAGDAEVAALAAVDAGLKPDTLTKEEQLRFRGVKRTEYLEARAIVLQKWAADPTTLLTEDAAAAAAPAPLQPAARAAHRFLHLTAGINFGVLRGEEKDKTKQEGGGGGEEKHGDGDAAAAAADASDAGGGAPSSAALAAALADALAAADMATTTEKGLRKALEARFGVPLADRKAAIKAQVTAFLEGRPYVPDGGKEDDDAAAAAAPAAPPPSYARPGATAVVVGAGPAGLAAASHLTRCGVAVTLLEARDRPGGRVVSDGAAVGCPVDLGASIITGVAADPTGGHEGGGRRADPAALLARQLGVSLHPLGGALPLYDGVAGGEIDPSVDARADVMHNALLDDARDRVAELSAADAEGRSLGAELEAALAARLEARAAAAAAGGAGAGAAPAPAPAAPAPPANGDAAEPAADAPPASDGDDDDAAAREAAAFAAAGDADLRVLGWHMANSEYGCAAPLASVSLPHWNQDEAYGGFGGGHAMVVGGFGGLLARFAAAVVDAGATLRLSTPVARVAVADDGVAVTTAGGDVVRADVAVVTVPLGVLQAGGVAFDPPLPDWKADAVRGPRALGYGDLNKAFLRFPRRFWGDGVDYFGIVRGPSPAERGRAFMCWDVGRFQAGAPPVLAVLFSGEAGAALEGAPDGAAADAALAALRSAFGGEAAVPAPTATLETRWASDPYAKGAYSYVPPGASGATYDALAKPVGRRLLFAGEATARAHPDTVGGAIISGLREATRVLVAGGALAAAEEELAATRAEAAAAAPASGDGSGEDDEDGWSSEEEEEAGGAASTAQKGGRGGRGRKRGAADGADGAARARAPKKAALPAPSPAPPRPTTAVEAEAEVRRAEREREEVRALWRAAAAAAAGDAAPLAAALDGAARGGPRPQAAALKVLAGAAPRALAAVAARRDLVAVVAGWVEAAVGDRHGGAAAADGARALAGLPLPPPDRAATGVERAVRRVAESAVDAGARAAGEAALDAWFGRSRGAAASGAGPRPKPAATGAPPAPPPPAPIVVTDADLDDTLKRRLVDAEAAAAAAAAHAAAAAEAEAALAAARAGGKNPAAALEDFAAFAAARAKAREREAGLARRRERAARALAEADDDAGAAAPGDAAAALKAAVRDAVSGALKPLFKRGKLTRAQYDEAGRKAYEKIMGATPADTRLPLSEGARAKMAGLAAKVAARVRGKE